MPFPGVFADHTFNDFEQFFVHGLGEMISSWVVRRGRQENSILLLEKHEEFFRDKCFSIVANDFERGVEAGENVIL